MRQDVQVPNDAEALVIRLTQRYESRLREVGVRFALGRRRRITLRGFEAAVSLHVWPQAGLDTWDWPVGGRTWLGRTIERSLLRDIEAEASRVLERYEAGDLPPFTEVP